MSHILKYRHIVCTIIVLLCLAGNVYIHCSGDLTSCMCVRTDDRHRLCDTPCLLLFVFVIHTKQSDHSVCDVLHLEIQCRKVSNAERVNWKAFRATIGAAYHVEVRISGGVHQVVVGQVGTWQLAIRCILVCGVFRDVSVSCR